MNNIKQFTICSLLFFAMATSAQVNRTGLYGDISYTFGVHLFGGMNYYFGDIEKGGIFSKDAKNQINYFVEGGFSYAFFDYMMMRADLIHGRLSGNRANYTFKSLFLEPDFILEFHPWKIFSEKYDFYGIVGAGLTFSRVNFYDRTYDFHRNLQVYMPVIPLGVGYRYNFSNGFQIGAEFAYRFALMDSENNNLDGFPYTYNGKIQRGKESKFFDGYYILGITFGYQWSK